MSGWTKENCKCMRGKGKDERGKGGWREGGKGERKRMGGRKGEREREMGRGEDGREGETETLKGQGKKDRRANYIIRTQKIHKSEFI